MIKTELINISLIENNTGQIAGLPKNPRFIKDDKFKKLVKSIQDLPEMLEMRELIIFPFKKKYVVIGGNMRLRALSELKYTEVPCKVLKANTPIEKLNEIAIKDNVSVGEDDWDLLANEWNVGILQDWGMDIPEFKEESTAEEDNYEIPDSIKTDIKLGDLFEIDNHRLLCGDSGEIDQINKLFGDKKADCVFTDPPYGVSIGKKNRMLNSFQKAGSNLTDIQDDEATPDELKVILTKSFTNLKTKLNDSCAVFVTAPQGGGIGMMMMMMMMQDAGLAVKHDLIWLKNIQTFSMGRLDYDYKHEPILMTWNKTHKRKKEGAFQTSIWTADKPRANKEHPTMKPIALPENAMLNHTDKKDIIADIYLGSGTTMVAAHQLGRYCYGMEIMPHYCQVIIDRMILLDPTINIMKNGKPYKKTVQNEK